VPADKLLYALRDVTATVEDFSLIAASIMSKKLAGGADRIVLDVKCGSGAFMKTLPEAQRLAQELVKIGTGMGRQTVALITNMTQPLGNSVGNALEIKEAIDVLKGKGPDDLRELCFELGSRMLIVGECEKDMDSARRKLESLIESGAALEKMKQWIFAQGGNPEVTENYDLLPNARYSRTLFAEKPGYIAAIDAEGIGMTAMLAGAGRETKGQEIDMGAGVVLHKKMGEHVEARQPLATVYSNDDTKLENAFHHLGTCFTRGSEAVEKPTLLLGSIE
jgi:pyrimidine-nucleoside phosphorylase